MKILYAIQGTGNGHISRALQIIPELKKLGKVDIALSGNQCEIDLPWPIKYRLHGASFIFGKNGGIDFLRSFKNINFWYFMQELMTVPVKDYDIILNDFEPVVAWSCRLKRKSSVGISHQWAVLHPNAATPSSPSSLGKTILKYYAPTSQSYGFHFESLDVDVFTPVIRQEIRNAVPTNGTHYTVYLPSYSDERIISFLSQFPKVKWEVFSKHALNIRQYNNIKINPVCKEGFWKSMVNAKGVFCNAGFETPAETLYLNKKLCVIPMKGQYEQQCNAAMLKKMGVTVFDTLKAIDQKAFNDWLQNNNRIHVRYEDNTRHIISDIIKKHAPRDTKSIAC